MDMDMSLAQEPPGSPCSSECSEVKEEELWREGGECLARSKISEKMVEEKEQQLREYIRDNYSRIKGVEKELAIMQREMKLVDGPKRGALEMLRKKIEEQNETVLKARSRYKAAQQFLAATEEELHRAESVKERLCSELNLLVQQSARIQLQKLEQLTNRLENLQAGAGSRSRPSANNPPTEKRARSASSEPADRSGRPPTFHPQVGNGGGQPRTGHHSPQAYPTLQMSTSEPIRKSSSERSLHQC